MKRRILIAAAKVVALKGIEKASVTEIAKKARVTRSLIQYYLPKQQDLMVSLIELIAQEGYLFFVENDPLVKCRFKMPVALEKRIRLNFSFFAEYPHYFQCFMLFFYNASYRADCRALNTKIVNTAVAAMKESVKSEDLAERIYFAMNAAIQRCFIVESSEALDRAVARYLKEVEELLD